MVGYVQCRGKKLYKFRPKSHTFDHMLMTLDETALNPKDQETWSEETLMGHMKKIGRHCHGGSAVSNRTSAIVIAIAFGNSHCPRKGGPSTQ